MLWPLDSNVLRVVLRIYFITIITLLGLIGSECCKCAAKVDLLRGKNVKLNRMTGWLRPIDILSCIWRLKRLPGGLWLGIVMIITTLLSLTADLTVALLVVPVLTPGQCLFTIGLVMDWQTTEGFVAPPPNGYPALIASNVQIYSANSNCSVGIYKKVPVDGDPLFCGRERDILGRWECEDLNRDSLFGPDITESSIKQSLTQYNLQYPNVSSTDYYNDQQQTTHLAVWSSSIGSDTTGSPFDVLVSIDLNSSVTDTKTMKTFKCTGRSNSTEGQTAINAILSQMESVTTLSQWASGLEGILYLGADTKASPYARSRLEQYLNTMTMVQGGSNSVLSMPSDNLEYGCIVNKTKISVGILFLVVFTAFVLVTTILYWIVLLLIISKHAIFRMAKRKSGIKNIKPVPDGVISWMLQAARENVQGSDTNAEDAPMKENDLRDWNFTIVDSGQGVARMVRAKGNVTAVVQESGLKV